MRGTSNFTQSALVLLLSAAYLTLAETAGLAAEEVRLSKGVTAGQSRCLRELLHEHYIHYPAAGEVRKLIAEASVARASLRPNSEPAFIFVIEDIGYCGSAGCWLLVGERRGDGKCHSLADANADGGEVTILDRRDHGYRRLFAPCELYFDGRQYQQVREECPNDDVRR